MPVSMLQNQPAQIIHHIKVPESTNKQRKGPAPGNPMNSREVLG
jgi:hypothetical protein